MRPHNPWHDIFAFLLLLSATLVMVLVLLVTRHYYGGFSAAGRRVAWAVAIGSVLALASLAQSLARLYVQPAISGGRERPKRNP